MRRLFLRILTFARAGRADADLARELRAHLRLLEDDFLTRGMSRSDARNAARRAFGGQLAQVPLRHRDARSFRWLDDSWLDVKLGVRMLVKYPGLSIIGGIAMAVAIALGTASFAFFYSHLYPSMGLPQGDRLVALENWNVAVNNEWRQAAHDFVLWRDEMKAVQEIGAFRNVARNLMIPGGSVQPITVAEITAVAFAAARVPPRLGRPILPDDERRDAAAVLVIGDDVWQTHFARDPLVVGREVRLGSTVHTIVGVMPEGFAFPMNHSYWTPLRVDPTGYARGEGPALFIFGRLAPEATIEGARSELAAIGQRSAALYPDTHAQLRPQVLPYTYPLMDIQDVSLRQVTVMQSMVSLLLVIVAVNIAILVFARTATRQGEIAVRTALGASRPRVVGQLFVEALVLSMVSATFGVMLAHVALAQGHAIMETEVGRLPFWVDQRIPPAAFIYVIGLVLVAAVLAGVVPALQATRHELQATLRNLSGATGLRLGKTWTVLIVGQVALAIAALPIAVATGLGDVQRATAVPQFAAEEFLAVRFAPTEEEIPRGVDPAVQRLQVLARLAALQAEMATRVEAEPWTADVSLASAIPGNEPSTRLQIEGMPASVVGEHAVTLNRVSLDFFQAFEVKLLTGRTLGPADRDAVVVNRTFVERVLGGEDALGRRVRYVAAADAKSRDEGAARSYEIVGVVSDLYRNAVNPEVANAVVYHPVFVSQPQLAALMIRVRGVEPATITNRVREIATSLDPNARLSTVPFVQIYRQEKIALRLVALVLTLIVSSVLLLSAAGIYALMSFTVSRRRKEIGIRAALGAAPRRLLRNIFARAAGQLALGVILGLTTVAVLDWTSDGELLAGKQLILLPVITALMMGAGLLAAWGPARRGLKLQPTDALREE